MAATNWLEGQSHSNRSAVLALSLLVALAALLVSAPLPLSRAAEPPPITVINKNASGFGSLRWAIEQANAVSGADTVAFDPKVSGTIVLTGTLPDVTGTLIVSGPGSGVVSISGAQLYRVFFVDSGATLTLTGVTIRDGKSGAGGAIYSAGALAISGTVLSGNASGGTLSDGNGGAVFIAGGTATVNGGQMRSNTAQLEGGAMFIDSGDVVINEGQVVNNTSQQSGGGICLKAGRLTINGGQFRRNESLSGGGLCVDSGEVIVNGTRFLNNRALWDGGAIYLSHGSVTVNGGQINGNTARGNGSGVYVFWGSMNLSGGQVNRNIAEENGGGVYVEFGTAQVTGADMIGNEARGASPNGTGGAVHVAYGSATISETRLLADCAHFTGGALFTLSPTATLTVTDSCIVANSTATAVDNAGTGTLLATNNWWGATDGPSGGGAGHGDSVGVNVDYQPFLTAPVLDCGTSKRR